MMNVDQVPGWCLVFGCNRTVVIHYPTHDLQDSISE